MASSSLVHPSVPQNRQASNDALDWLSLKSSSSVRFRGIKHGFQRLDKSRVPMSVSVASTTAIDDELFADYKPTTAFLFPGQITSPVQWETTVATLLSKGLMKSYELGPGKVIAGIVKRMDKTSPVENISA